MIDQDIMGMVNAYIPSNYKKYLVKNGHNSIAYFESNRENELRLMKVHHENSKRSGLNIIGIDDLISSLIICNQSNIFIINIRNERYYIKLYFESDKKNFLGYIIIALRNRNENRLKL